MSTYFSGSLYPRLSATAAKAHEWMPVIPGEDGALAVAIAIAIAHVLLVEGLWNKEFVGDFNEGINLFKKGETVQEESFTKPKVYFDRVLPNNNFVKFRRESVEINISVYSN